MGAIVVEALAGQVTVVVVIIVPLTDQLAVITDAVDLVAIR